MIVKAPLHKDNSICIKNVYQGEVFFHFHSRSYFQRLDYVDSHSPNIQCSDLERGVLHVMNENIMVIPVKAHIVVEK